MAILVTHQPAACKRNDTRHAFLLVSFHMDMACGAQWRYKCPTGWTWTSDWKVQENDPTPESIQEGQKVLMC